MSGGVGLRVALTMPGEDDGVAFVPSDACPLVIQIHTQDSFAVSSALSSAWSDFCRAGTAKNRAEALRRARVLVRKVLIPNGAYSFGSQNSEGIKGSPALLTSETNLAPPQAHQDALPLQLPYFKSRSLEVGELVADGQELSPEPKAIPPPRFKMKRSSSEGSFMS